MNSARCITANTHFIMCWLQGSWVEEMENLVGTRAVRFGVWTNRD